MDQSLCLLLTIVALSHSVEGFARGELVDTGEGIQEFKYHSFQVQVAAFKKECFYQYFSQNTSLSIIWHVMSAGGAAELAAIATLVKQSPDEKVMYTSAFGQMGDHREENLGSGTYEICIDNGLSYVGKLVYLWFDYQRVREWDEAVEKDLEVQQQQLKRDLIRDILRTIERQLHDMNYYQALYREKSVQHEVSLHRLESIINNRSLVALLLIILTTVLQVTFVRKLFQTPNTSTNTKSSI